MSHLSTACLYFSIFFFFQAEDGIRDVAVTGVQTCALPISNRAASRDSADAPLRGRLEGPVVRNPRSPDHSRGARVHPYRLAAVPARPTRAVLPVRGLRCGCAAGLALPPQPPALRPAAGDAGGSHAAPFHGGTGAGAAPGRAPGDRRAAATQPRRPAARRGARRADTAGARPICTHPGTAGARGDPRPRGCGSTPSPPAHAALAAVAVRVELARRPRPPRLPPGRRAGGGGAAHVTHANGTLVRLGAAADVPRPVHGAPREPRVLDVPPRHLRPHPDRPWGGSLLPHDVPRHPPPSH